MYRRAPAGSKGHGLYATADARSGQVIGSWTNYLNAQEAIKDEEIKSVIWACEGKQWANRGFSEKLIITLFLAIHRNSGVLDIYDLPQDHQTPMWYEEIFDEVQKIPSLWLEMEAKRDQQCIFASRMASESDIDPEDWLWADGIVSSRTITLLEARLAMGDQVKSDTPVNLTGWSNAQTSLINIPEYADLALVPELDCCNHSFHPNVHWEVRGTAVQLIADIDIAADEELCISYGQEKSNKELFFCYGFTVENNPNWTCSITAKFDDEDPEVTKFWQSMKNAMALRQINFDSSRPAEQTGEGIRQFWAGMFADHQNQLVMLYLSANPEGIMTRSQIVAMFDNLEDVPRSSVKMTTKNVIRLLREKLDQRNIKIESTSIDIARIAADERRGVIDLLARIDQVELNINSWSQA